MTLNRVKSGSSTAVVTVAATAAAVAALVFFHNTNINSTFKNVYVFEIGCYFSNYSVLSVGFFVSR